MAAGGSAARRSKRPLLSEKQICGEEVGPRGLSYEESSVVYSLLWNQPSLYPSQFSYSLRHSNPLVRKGGQAEVKTTSLGLPLFYTESPDLPLSEGEEEGGGERGGERGGEAERERRSQGEEELTEIHEESPSTIQCVTPWSMRTTRTVHHIAPSTEADIVARVRSEVGYEFPPVISRMIEANVQRKWHKWRMRGLVHTNGSTEEQSFYRQLLVDTHVFMAREIERRLLLVDPDSSDSEREVDSSTTHTQPSYERRVLLSPGEFCSSTASSSDEDVSKGKGKKRILRKRKKHWDRTLPQTKRVVTSKRHETVRNRLRQQRREDRASSSSGEEGEGGVGGGVEEGEGGEEEGEGVREEGEGGVGGGVEEGEGGGEEGEGGTGD